jgi:hypothetical protein
MQSRGLVPVVVAGTEGYPVPIGSDPLQSQPFAGAASSIPDTPPLWSMNFRVSMCFRTDWVGPRTPCTGRSCSQTAQSGSVENRELRADLNNNPIPVTDLASGVNGSHTALIFAASVIPLIVLSLGVTRKYALTRMVMFWVLGRLPQIQFWSQYNGPPVSVSMDSLIDFILGFPKILNHGFTVES